jgi:hypothetical protein
MRCFWMGPSSLFVEEKRQRNPCTGFLRSSPMDDGRSSGFGSLVRKGKAPGIGKRFSRTSSSAGSKGYASSSLMTFSGWRRRSKRSFLRQIGNFVSCTPCGLRSTKRGRRTGKPWPRISRRSIRAESWAEEALRNLARTVGHGLSQDRGAVEDQDLCPSGVPASPQAHPKVSLYDEPAGTAGQGGEEADHSSGGLLWGRSSGKPLILGPEPSGRGMGSAQTTRFCGNPCRELPCCPYTLNGVLWLSSKGGRIGCTITTRNGHIMGEGIDGKLPFWGVTET